MAKLRLVVRASLLNKKTRDVFVAKVREKVCDGRNEQDIYHIQNRAVEPVDARTHAPKVGHIIVVQHIHSG